ncbi:MAG: response regulator [Hungatella sp.]|jgi:YesN/AraC family two-component response regulator|nr:response regulator [Hungatella sp.]
MYKLIIVDDEKNIREGLAQCYSWNELGFELCSTFPDGKSALDYVRRYRVDVVLSDIRMPVMDGLKLAEQLSLSYPSVIMVLLSGFAEFEYAQTALRYGVKEYLLKPVKYEEAVKTFQNICEMLDQKTGVKKSSEPFAGYYDQIVSQVTEYLQTHYRDASLEDAAAVVALSPNYLSRIFKRKKGMNFSEFLQEIKMETAASLLCDVTRKTYEIAAEVGYDNPKNFTRAFKQYSGKTPREFREQGQSL